MKLFKIAALASVGVVMSSAAALAATFDFAYTGSIVTWTATTAGEYRVTATGAQGASAETGYAGGRGAEIAGTFSFAAGDVFQILVGGAGTGSGTASEGNGGGGGGSFFVSSANDPLLVAGGGGGTRRNVTQNGTDASVTEAAYLGSGSSSSYTPTLSARAGGTGGIVSSGSWGSAGAGFYGDGASDCRGSGGKSWANGMLGGTGSGAGGFGGGGSGAGCWGGGGGGGYTGGDGGRVAGGGGSFNAGTDAYAMAGVGYGNGSLSIEMVSAIPVPASLPLMLTGLGFAGFIARRRKKATS